MTEQRTDGVAQNQGRQETFKVFWQVGMAFACVSLSIVSFYTTFAGTDQFMPVLLAIFYTIGVQLLLLVAAWYIGVAKDIFAPTSLMMIGLFCLAFVMSATFSTVEIFDIGYDEGSEKKALETRALSTFEQNNIQIRSELASLRAESGETLLGSDPFENWEESVLEVALAASSVREQLIQLQIEQRDSELARIQSLRGKSASLESDLIGITSSMEQIDANLESGNAALRKAQEEVAALELQFESQSDLVDAAKAELEREIKFGNPAEGRGPGRGTFAIGLEKALEPQQEFLSLLESELSTARQEEEETRAYLEALRKDRVSLEAEETTLREQIATNDGDLSALNSQGENSSVTELVDFQNASGQMAVLVKDYKNSLLASDFQQANSLCETILTALRSPTVTDRVELTDLSCAQSLVRGEVERIDGILSRESAFVSTCIVGGDNYENQADATPDQIIDAGRRCVGIAGLPVSATAEVRAAYDQMTRESSPDAPPYVRYKNAISEGDTTAFVAMFLAILMDGLVLGCALAGGRGEAAARLAIGGDSTSEADCEQLVENLMELLGPESEDSHRVVLMALAALHKLDRPRHYSDEVTFSYGMPTSDLPAGLSVSTLSLMSHAMTVGDRHHCLIDRDQNTFFATTTAVSALKRLVVRLRKKAPSQPGQHDTAGVSIHTLTAATESDQPVVEVPPPQQPATHPADDQEEEAPAKPERYKRFFTLMDDADSEPPSRQEPTSDAFTTNEQEEKDSGAPEGTADNRPQSASTESEPSQPRRHGPISPSMMRTIDDVTSDR